MTERFKGCVVTFDRDIREDDVKDVLALIGMVKGVYSVEPSMTNSDDYMNREHALIEIRTKVMEVLYPQLQRSK